MRKYIDSIEKDLNSVLGQEKATNVFREFLSSLKHTKDQLKRDRIVNILNKLAEEKEITSLQAKFLYECTGLRVPKNQIKKKNKS